MKTIRSECGRILRSAANGLGDREMDAVISTPDLALDNNKVLGWEKPLPASVPLLDTHRDAADGVASVIGRCVPRFEGNRLCGRLCFASGEINERAELAYQLCANGFIDSVSVSFIPLKFTYAKDRKVGMDIIEARLLETSIVPVGSDSHAKIFARSFARRLSGHETAADRRIIAEAIQRRHRELEARWERMERLRQILDRTP